MLVSQAATGKELKEVRERGRGRGGPVRSNWERIES